ncbi:MAG TPA: toll/interleukin-1 receptor domain-containing protein, partial [Ktedonobacterales bacterium]
MSYVFIAYARQDAPFVSRLVSDVQATGYNTWYDVAQLMPGDDWFKTIEHALLRASAVVFVATRYGNASQFALGEVQAALRLGIPVIPLVVEEPPTATELQRIQWIDFRPDYQAALDRLLAALPTLVDRGRPLPPPEPKSKGYVFISYAEEDSEFVAGLRDFLRGRGYGYWDYQESDRDYHKQFSLELEEIIQGAAATL